MVTGGGYEESKRLQKQPPLIDEAYRRGRGLKQRGFKVKCHNTAGVYESISRGLGQLQGH